MKRNLIFSVVAIAICGLTYFWIAALKRAEKNSSHPPAASSPSAQPPQESAEHELKALGEQLKKKPGHAPVLFRMAELERAAGRPARAVVHLQALLQAEPSNSEARLELGRAYFEAGDVQSALTETRNLLEKEPKNVDALYNLGAIYGNLGNIESARRYWQEAVQVSPDSDSGRRAKTALDQTAVRTSSAR